MQLIKAFELGTIIGAVLIVSYITAISSVALYEVDAIPEPTGDTLIVKVEAFQWAWRFEYPDGTRSGELTVRAGQPVILEVISRDVVHSLYFPELGFKIDAMPNKVNRFFFQVNEPGEFNILCAEFCGLGHADMRSKLTVLPGV